MNSVDVVVPCYNYARFLERCVGSVLSQDGVAVRVLIIDDTSTDDTSEVGRRLAALDSRVEFRRHEVNQGHIATYNEGLLGWATAAYSLMLSADDALTPGALARAAGLMNSHPEVGMTYGRALVIGDDAAVNSAAKDIPADYQTMSGPAFLERCCAFGNPVPAPTVVVRTTLQQRLGGYRAHLPHSGDMEMWMRFATQGSIGILRAVQAFYRWHGANMGMAYYSGALGDLTERKAACDDVLTTWGSGLPDLEKLLKAMDRRVAEEAFWMASKAFDAGDATRSAVCLQFAKEHCPELERSRSWSRFQAKRLVGPVVWRRIRTLVNRLRGVQAAPPVPASNHFHIGETTGWWPETAC
jgi:glycosyltransferase involved in cell wall biosynthesis